MPSTSDLNSNNQPEQSPITEILLGKNSLNEAVTLGLTMATRHGLITGATGTGKTVSLQVLAENFSKMGVPVFMSDVKSDLSGLAQSSTMVEKIASRVSKLDLTNFSPAASPVCFWDLYGQTGLSIRTSISELGPVLLTRLLDLNEVQSGVLQIAFRVADDQSLLILDLKDLRALLTLVSEQASEIQIQYGNVSASSIGAIQRRLLVLEEAGGNLFFGEPAINLKDLIRCTEDGKGIINILDATKLIQNSRLYSTFLLWLLSELFEELPEVGDQNKPKFVFFFDEAHLLFNDSPSALIEKIETVVRLIRSKGVGVYFVTQSPKDIPVNVLGQLGNRIQHALRAFTPADTKVVKTAAENFRPNPNFSTEEAITALAIGEALVSTLDTKGSPQIVQRTLIVPPESQIGPITEEKRSAIINNSVLKSYYNESIDRESAYEVLAKRRAEIEASNSSKNNNENLNINIPKPTPRKSNTSKSASRRQGFTETFFKSVLRSFGSKVGTQIVRGALGTILNSKIK